MAGENNSLTFEEEEYIRTINAMTPEQQALIITQLPDDILWNEMRRRYNEAIILANKMKNLIN